MGGSKKQKTTGWSLFQTEKWTARGNLPAEQRLSFKEMSQNTSKQWRELTGLQKQAFLDVAAATRDVITSSSSSDTPTAAGTGATVAVSNVASKARPGPVRRIEEKGRNAWKHDSKKPRFGLASRNKRREGGIAAIHRVDASRAIRVDGVRVSRISRVAALEARASKRAAKRPPESTASANPNAALAWPMRS